MAIELVIEDGSGVPFANSYASVATARAYAEQRGVTLPDSDETIAGWLISAMDYLEGKDILFQGLPTYIDQSLVWPRDGVVVGTVPLINSAVPKNIVKAQCALVIAQNQGLVLLPNLTPQDFVIEEQVDVIKTKYADPTLSGGMPTFTGVDSLLTPFYKTSLGFGLRTIRV